MIGSIWAQNELSCKVNVSYCYWTDKDKSGKSLPTTLYGSLNTKTGSVTQNAASRQPLSAVTTENINNTGTTASYWLNGENLTGAWAQDFVGVNGKYINDKYPYLVENTP